MTFFQVCDTLCFHPKSIRAGNAALGLWVRSGSWAMQNLTDGHVPGEMARTIGAPGEIKRLVDAGLWIPDGSDYRFHEWSGPGRQRTRAEILAKREEDRRRQAGWRAKREAEKAAQDGALTDAQIYKWETA